ncbi:MAG: hypothetical protein KME47_09940 [Nodosilinea sp. WJT8-NPBG4]|jgi:hypothetical protein|nr:hypothetical protein [Nodosilinea sp. WJT8-NPBG4]
MSKTDYSYGSDAHINLAIECMTILLANHKYDTSLTPMAQTDALAAMAFCMAESMLTQIKSL